MASKRDRLRKLERARVERRIARQAQQARRKRQTQAAIGASVALVLIVVGVTWLLGAFDAEPEQPPTIAAGTCTWFLKDPASNSGITDTDHPPTTGEIRTGTGTLMIETNLGVIEATIDLSQAACTAASLAFLGENDFYANSRCHYLDLDAKLLQCGDKTGNGSGAPSYTFARENLPAEPIGGANPSPSASASPSPDPSASPSPGPPAIFYAKGTIIMANTDEDTNAGQFSIIYGDGSTLSGDYSIVGTVTKGLSIVEEIAKDGARTAAGEPTGAGNPNKDLIVQRLSLATPPGAPPSPTATATEGAQS